MRRSPRRSDALGGIGRGATRGFRPRHPHLAAAVAACDGRGRGPRAGLGDGRLWSLDPGGLGARHSVARQAEYLAGWMREIGLDSAVIVGHDLGGGVDQILAVRTPELVRGLVLTNAICYDSWPIPSVKAMRAAGPLVERLPDAIVRFNLYIGLFLRGHDDRARAKESLAEHWPNYEEAGGAAALVRQVRSLDVRDTLAIADQIPNLDVPARLVWGAADQFQKIGYGYRLAYDLGATLDRVEGGKHFVPEDHPERVAAAVNGLLEQAALER